VSALTYVPALIYLTYCPSGPACPPGYGPTAKWADAKWAVTKGRHIGLPLPESVNIWLPQQGRTMDL